MVETKKHKVPCWAIYTLLFVLTLGGMALTSWNYVTGPSPHFHFVDLAESFMQGRLDTLTPHRRKEQKALPDDPQGLQEAVVRQLGTGGWNDWVSYNVAVLKSDETYMGVWPWKSRKKGQKGYKQRNDFVTLNGDWLEFDKDKDIRRVCLEQPDPKADSEAFRSFRMRDRFDAEEAVCLNPGQDDFPNKFRCPKGHKRVKCLTKRHFVSFPPFPAIAMMPFVAIWHYDFNDVLFTLVMAALNAVFLFMLLRRLRGAGYSTKSDWHLLVLVFLFSFGTVNFFSAVRGSVWFTALIIGVTMNLLYLYFATDLKNPLLAGLFLALGVATRVPLAFACVYFGLQLVLQKAAWDKDGILLRLRQGILFAIPCLVVGAVLMAYNMARFDSPFEFGHRFLLDGTRNSIVDHGLFSFWFLRGNLSAALTNVPQFMAEYPYVKITKHGLSLLCTTPVFFYLLWPRKKAVQEASKDKFRVSLHTIAWITVAVVATPGLLYQNTGWEQFGYRFALDYMPLLFMLLAMDSRKFSKLFYALVFVAVVVNLFGAITFVRFPQFYH